MTKECGYCQRICPRGRRYCSDQCQRRQREMKAAERASAAGKLCKHCKVPVTSRRRYCSDACKTAATVRLKLCPVCMRKFHGNSKLCGSSTCSNTMRKQKVATTAMHQWLRERRWTADLELLPTKTSMYRRALHSRSGNVAISRCYDDCIADYPADRKVYALLWKDEKYVYAQCRRPRVAIGVLQQLKEFDIELLTELVVRRGLRG